MKLIVREVAKKHLTLHQGGGQGGPAEIPDDAFGDDPDREYSDQRSYEPNDPSPEDLGEPPEPPPLRRVK
mgnify:FL=1|jgi:hypothetical protein